MAITNVIDNVTAEVDLASATAFTVVSSALITADNLAIGETALIYRLGPSGDYSVVTDTKGSVYLSAFPNTVLLDGPGTYKITKDVTDLGAYVGYEE